MRIVVTGTDTGVGKTYVSAALCDESTTYVKAAQTGDDDDARTVRERSGATVHTLAAYPEPLSPERVDWTVGRLGELNRACGSGARVGQRHRVGQRLQHGGHAIAARRERAIQPRAFVVELASVAIELEAQPRHRAGRVGRPERRALADDLAGLRKNGKEVVVVSSGAIALGRNALKLPKGALKLEDSQAAAAVGQIDLAHAYEEAFRVRGLVAAQVLLTLGDTEERRRYLNARNTMTTLLKLGAIPVVNENDTVATSEIRYGDNDRLAARVASMSAGRMPA